MNTVTVTQEELEDHKSPEKRLELLRSKGIPVKGKNLNTDDYFIGVTLQHDYVYSWEKWDA